ncbi:MAG: hypothetical protein HY318_01095 [Armatimonadetes bacterium]|nr:hypothetical protein [Armatimonadota bacterium]
MDHRIIRAKLDMLKNLAVVESRPVTPWRGRAAHHLRPGEYEYLDEWGSVPDTSRWPALQTVFLWGTVEVPHEWPVERTCLTFDFENLEGLLSIGERPWAGLDFGHHRARCRDEGGEFEKTRCCSVGTRGLEWRTGKRCRSRNLGVTVMCRRSSMAIIAILVLTLTSSILHAEDQLLRFQELDAKLGATVPGENPNPTAIEVLEILIGQVYGLIHQNPRLIDGQIREALKPYDEAIRQNKGEVYPVEEYRWVSVSAARHGNRVAISANYGPASRLAVFDTSTCRRCKVPPALEWLVPWHQFPVFLPDGGLMIKSDRVMQGNRIGSRVDFLTRVAQGYRPIRSMERIIILDYGGAEVKGNRMTLVSIDESRSFFTSAATPLFGREEVYVVRDGVPSLIRDTKLQPTLRFLDQWMLQARAAGRPSRLQRQFKRLISEEVMLTDYQIRKLVGGRIRVDVGLDTIPAGRIRFLLRGGTNCRVLSVRFVRQRR